MSLTKYLQTIEGIDPGKIFVENVRSAYNISRYNARLICEMAVEENLFKKKVGLVCPGKYCNNRIIAEFDFDEVLPEEIECHICEAHDNETYIYKTSKLDKIEFYQLNN